jgi:hypothetical protein
MHDRISRPRLEQCVESGAIRQVSDYQFSIFRNRLAVAPAEIIEDDNIMACL